ncbi:unnamed protein product [Rotaria sp. Silwood1]|nr:unnamed protein product [Rotaria sp. Silwood1]
MAAQKPSRTGPTSPSKKIARIQTPDDIKVNLNDIPNVENESSTIKKSTWVRRGVGILFATVVVCAAVIPPVVILTKRSASSTTNTTTAVLISQTITDTTTTQITGKISLAHIN